MEGDIGFNLDRQLWEWTVQVKKIPEVTEVDSEELKCHLLDSVEDWERAGLDQEEAFWVASRHLRLSFDVVEDYHTVNNRFLQMEKTVLVLASILGFFLSYYFFACSAMLVFYGVTVFGVLDTCFMPICKNLMEPNAPVRKYFYQIFRNFDLAFPLIASFSFIALYLRYYRKTKI